jgi:small subunit ribosomal protein S6
MVQSEHGEKQGYELMLILTPHLSESETEKELDSIKHIIDELGGKIFSEDIWGIREMAYTIKNCEKGYYAVYYIDFKQNEKVKELEKTLTIQPNLLRSLILKISKHHKIKTYEEYEEEALKEEEEEKKEKEKKEEERRKPAPKPRTQKTVKKVEEKPVKTEKVEEKESEKKTEKDAMEKLSEVDKKLKSLIDDPDILL